MFRLAHAEPKQRDGEQAGNDRDPEHRLGNHLPTTASVRLRSTGRRTRRRIERLAQAERGAAQMRRCQVRHQRIARRAARTPLPMRSSSRAVSTRPSPGASANRGFVNAPSAVAEQREAFALAQVVAQRAREDFDDKRGRLGQPLDQTDRKGACDRASSP